MIHMAATLLPQLYRLVECQEDMANTHGNARAVEWFGEVLAANPGLFIRIDDTPRKPKLTVIRGGM